MCGGNASVYLKDDQRAASSLVTAPFNDVQTLKFKTQVTVATFTAALDC